MYEEIRSQLWEYYKRLRGLNNEYPCSGLTDAIRFTQGEIAMWKRLAEGGQTTF